MMTLILILFAFIDNSGLRVYLNFIDAYFANISNNKKISNSQASCVYKAERKKLERKFSQQSKLMKTIKVYNTIEVSMQAKCLCSGKR
jgi:hypothetical protein